MVTEVFGLPGAGKSSFCAYLAISEQNKIFTGKSPYKRIVSNVEIKYPGVVYMSFSDMLKYDLGWETLCLIDEGLLEFDNRDHKNFTYEKLEFFIEHRRHKLDIWIFIQQAGGFDKKIRSITDQVYYIHKGSYFRSISYLNKIPYGILIPSKKDTGSEKYGEIIQGYHRGSFFDRIFCKRIYRPLVYGYYDSFCHASDKAPVAKYLAANVEDKFLQDYLCPEDQIEALAEARKVVASSSVRYHGYSSSNFGADPFVCSGSPSDVSYDDPSAPDLPADESPIDPPSDPLCDDISTDCSEDTPASEDCSERLPGLRGFIRWFFFR